MIVPNGKPAQCSQALRAKPEVNASWMGDFIRYYDDVDVSVAVQTPNGLMVPIVKHADELGLLEISAQVKSLAKKVRPADLLLCRLYGR